jgi:hypothetical protein
MKEKEEKVLGHIVWLLKEVQKPVEASRSGDIKRVRSCGKVVLECGPRIE